MPLHTGTLDLLSTTSWRESREFLLREILSLSGLYYVGATATGLLEADGIIETDLLQGCGIKTKIG